MTSAYATVLGGEMKALPRACRALHEGPGTFHGQITVGLSRNPLWRVLAHLAGFPAAASHAPLRFEITRLGQRDQWLREIGATRLSSQQWVTADGLLAERMGPAVVTSALRRTSAGLRLETTSVRLLKIPLPRWLWPVIKAEERGDEDVYHFDIAVALPFRLGMLVSYRGWLSVPSDRSPSG